MSHRRSPKLAVWMSLIAAGVLSPVDVRAQIECSGKAALHQGDDAGPKIAKPILDFGKLATYDKPEGREKDCKEKIASAAARHPDFKNKTWLCSQIKEAGRHKVTVYAALGNSGYKAALTVEVTCAGGVKTCSCPEGWISDSNGGGSPSCKRVACSPITGTPLPGNGTQLGTWGFSWGNSLYQWGKANCVNTPWVGN